MVECKIRQGDCLDAETGIATLESVDVIITDPPYESEAHTKGRRIKLGPSKGLNEAYGDGRIIVERPVPFDSITEEQREAFGALCGKLVAAKPACFIT
jgi:16S rRNA G966 N2-methylase RsmD